MAKSKATAKSGGGAAPVRNTPAAVDAQLYRDAMRQHAGAVTIIAVGPPGARTGLTATAMCSVSDSPPTILICVNRNASAHDLIARHGAFSANVLADGQQELAMRFAGKAGLAGEQRFSADDWATRETGAPVLKGALTSLDCEVVATFPHETHTIYLGRVRAADVRSDAAPLVYFRGGFAGLGKG